MLRRLGLVTGLAMLIAVPALAAPAVAGVASKSPPTTIVLTNASNGQSVVAAKGDLVVVELSGAGAVRWSEASIVPSSTAKPVLVKVSGHQSKNGSSTTVFRAVGYGTAGLQATGVPICPSAGPCPTYVVLWQAQVVVPVQDPPGAGA